MNYFCLDASALAKRYVPETGSALVDFILGNVAEHRVHVLNVSYAEVVWALVRLRNSGRLSAGRFGLALINLEGEIVQSLSKHLLSFNNSLVTNALPLIVKHSINATDAILLRLAIDVSQLLRGQGNDLVLVASDQRLLRAAQAERLITFNPETQDQPTLAKLIGP